MRIKSLLIIFVLLISFFSYSGNSYAVSVVTDIAIANTQDTSYGPYIITTGSGANGAWHYIWYAPSGTYISGFSLSGTRYGGQHVTTQTGLSYTTSGGLTVSGINGGSYIDFGDNGSTEYYYNVHVFVTSDVADQATVQAAKTSADTAATNASNAYNAANTAATNASTAATQSTNAVNQTMYGGKYGGSSEDVADIAGYIRILQYQLTT